MVAGRLKSVVGSWKTKIFWEKLSLIDGMANVYFGNTYVGESKIDTRLISDTLELSLGRDNQILNYPG